MKDPGAYNALSTGVHSILTTPTDADHSRFRRLLAHGFSEKAIREQEPLLLQYINLLIRGLHEKAEDGPQDMVAWYNWATFYLIGDLTFKESFDCLEKSVLGHILRHKGKETETSKEEIESTSAILVLAGSETTATLLSGVTYLLLKNPRVLGLLQAEVREKFANEDEVNLVGVKALTYQLAVLEKAFRIFPPAPMGSPRQIPPQGDTIMGHELPGGVSDCQWSPF